MRAETLHASALARVLGFRKRRAEERGNTSTFSCRHASPGLEEQRRKAGGLRRQEIKHKMKTSSGLKRSHLNFPTEERRENRSRGQEENKDKWLHNPLHSPSLSSRVFFYCINTRKVCKPPSADELTNENSTLVKKKRFSPNDELLLSPHSWLVYYSFLHIFTFKLHSRLPTITIFTCNFYKIITYMANGHFLSSVSGIINDYKHQRVGL